MNGPSGGVNADGPRVWERVYIYIFLSVFSLDERSERCGRGRAPGVGAGVVPTGDEGVGYQLVPGRGRGGK
jgi:hypothetical protein